MKKKNVLYETNNKLKFMSVVTKWYNVYSVPKFQDLISQNPFLKGGTESVVGY